MRLPRVAAGPPIQVPAGVRPSRRAARLERCRIVSANDEPLPSFPCRGVRGCDFTLHQHGF